MTGDQARVINTPNPSRAKRVREPEIPNHISTVMSMVAINANNTREALEDQLHFRTSLLRTSLRSPCGGFSPRVRFATGENGDDRDRTDDPLLAKQVLSQLSYAPAGASGQRSNKRDH